MLRRSSGLAGLLLVAGCAGTTRNVSLGQGPPVFLELFVCSETSYKVTFDVDRIVRFSPRFSQRDELRLLSGLLSSPSLAARLSEFSSDDGPQICDGDSYISVGRASAHYTVPSAVLRTLQPAIRSVFLFVDSVTIRNFGVSYRILHPDNGG